MVVAAEVAVAGPIHDDAERAVARVVDLEVGAVGLLADDVGVRLREAQAGCSGIGDGNHLVWIAGGARASDAGLAHGSEGTSLPKAAVKLPVAVLSWLSKSGRYTEPLTESIVPQSPGETDGG